MAGYIMDKNVRERRQETKDENRSRPAPDPFRSAISQPVLLKQHDN
jgi:hypothetical protein